MYAREWKCRVPNQYSDGFTSYLYETGVKESSSTAGFKGAQIFRRQINNVTEITLVTYWQSLAAIEAFAGQNIAEARLYPEDSKYELDPDLTVQHYEVIEHNFPK